MLQLFKVGVTVALVDRMSGALNSVGSALDKANKHTKTYKDSLAQLQSKMDKIHAVGDFSKKLMDSGRDAMDAMINPAIEYGHQLNRLNLLGEKHADIVAMTARAWQVANQTGTSTADSNLKAMIDLKAASMTQAEALHLVGVTAKMGTIMVGSAQHGGSFNAEEAGELPFAAIRTLEEEGHVTSAEEIERHLTKMVKVMSVTGGRITPQQYQGTMKYARTAKGGLDENFLYNVLPMLMMENQTGAGGSGGGAGGVGSSIAALFRFGVQGIMTKVAKENLAKYGLLAKGHVTEGSGLGVIAEKGVVDSALLNKDQNAWVKKYILENENIPEEIRNDRFKLSMWIAAVFRGQQLATSLLVEYATKQKMFSNHLQRMNQGPQSIDEMEDVAQKSPFAAKMKIGAAWNDLMTSFTEVGDNFGPAVAGIANMFRSLGNFLRENEFARKTIEFGALAATLGGAVGFVGSKFAEVWLKLKGAGAGGLMGVGSALALIPVALRIMPILWNVVLESFQLGSNWIIGMWNFMLFSMKKGLAFAVGESGKLIGWLVSLVNKKKGAEIGKEAEKISKAIDAPGVKIPEVNVLDKNAPTYGRALAKWVKGNPETDIAKKPGNGNTNKNEVTIAPGAITITPHPNQSPEEIGQMVIEAINKFMFTGLQTSSQAAGVMSSPMFGGT